MSIRPFMIEFTGTPEAGKTTTIQSLIKLFDDEGLKVGYVQESAKIAPSHILKDPWDSIVWMRYNTLANIISEKYRDNDIVFIDRGIFDAKFCGYKSLADELCTIEELKSYISAVDLEKFYPNLLIILSTTPEEAMKRCNNECNVDSITKYNYFLENFFNSASVPKINLDTTGLSPKNVVNTVYNFIKDNLKV